MPTVPQVTQASVPLRPSRARPPFQGPLLADVRPVGEGLVRAGEALRVADLQISEITLSEADAEFTRRINQRLFVDEDAYFKLTGKDAVMARQEAIEALDKIRDEVSAELLTSGRERSIFTLAANKRAELAKLKIVSHSFKERQRWDRSTSVANMQEQLESATNDPSFENLEHIVIRIAEEAANIAKIDGVDPRVGVAIAVSGMYTAAIESAIANDDLEHANNIMSRFAEDDILSADEIALRTKLKEGKLIAASNKLTEDAMRAHPDSPVEQLEFVEKFGGENDTDREIRRRAKAKTTTAESQRNTAENAQRSDDYNFLGERVITARRSGAAGLVIVEQLQALFPERFELLSTGQRATLESLAGVGSPTVTTKEGWMSYLKIMELATTDPSVLAELEPADFLGQMAPKQFDRVEKAINEVKGAGITSSTEQLGSRQKTLNDIAVKHGFDLTETELSLTGLLIQTEAMERLDEFIATQTRPPSEKEWLDIIDTMFLKVLLEDRRAPVRPSQPFSFFAAPRALFRSFGDPDEQFAFRLQLTDMTERQRAIVHADFNRINRRDPLPNEAETHFIELMDDPQTRAILVGK